MKRLLITTLLFLSVLSGARAQTVATVTGHEIFPSAGPPTNGSVCFSLQNFKPNIPRIASTGIVIQQQNWCITPSTVDGSFSVPIVRNDAITPSGTYWRVDFLWNGLQQSSANYLINHTPFNLDVEVPLNQIPVVGPNQVITQVFSCPQLTTSTTWICTHNFNDTNVQVQTYDSAGHVIYPDTVVTTSPNVVTITFVAAQSGLAVIVHAGSIAIATNQPNAVLQNPTGAQTIGGSSLLISAPLTLSSLAAANNNMFFVTGSPYPQTPAGITSAATACGSTPCIVVIPGTYPGAATTGLPTSIPDNVILWDQRGAGWSLIDNATNCNKSVGLLNIQSGNSPVAPFIPVGQVAATPSVCVNIYSYNRLNNTVTNAWGFNPNVAVPPAQATGWNVWGVEADVNVNATTAGQAIGFDSVSGTFLDSAAANQTMPNYAFRAFDGISAGNPPWQVGFHCDNPGLSCYDVQPPDSGLQVTQSITSSGSPQSVTTNAVSQVNRLHSQSWVSIDTGANQENVQLTGVTCGGFPCSTNFSISGIFTKNHAINSPITQYSSDRFWNAGNAVSRLPAYNMGSIQAYNNALGNTTSATIAWSASDSGGVNRTYEFFDGNNGHRYQDMGTGWFWQTQGGSPLVSLSSSGQFNIPVAPIGTGVQGTDTKILTSGTISGTGTVLCTDANAGATTSGCVFNQSTFTDGSISGNVTINNTATNIKAISVVFPSSGCPCRAFLSYSLYLDFTGITNQANIDFWVDDGGGHVMAGVETGQSNATTGAKTSASYGGFSNVTYANGANVTFTLKGIQPGTAGATVQAAPHTGSGPNSDFQVTVMPSVN